MTPTPKEKGMKHTPGFVIINKNNRSELWNSLDGFIPLDNYAPKGAWLVYPEMDDSLPDDGEWVSVSTLEAAPKLLEASKSMIAFLKTGMDERSTEELARLILNMNNAISHAEGKR